MQVELSGRDLRAVLGALRESRFGPEDSRLTVEAFEEKTGLSNDEANQLKSRLGTVLRAEWERTSRGRSIDDCTVTVHLTAGELRGITSALHHCIETMAPDFYSRIEMSRETAGLLRDRLSLASSSRSSNGDGHSSQR